MIAESSAQSNEDAEKIIRGLDKENQKTVDGLLDLKPAAPAPAAAPGRGAASAPPPAAPRSVPVGSTRRPN